MTKVTMPDPIRLRWNKWTGRYDISEDQRAAADADLITTEQAESYANDRVKQALESLGNFEEIVLTEMERRFSLRGEERQYERLPIDDTQVGVEFAIKQFRALMPKE